MPPFSASNAEKFESEIPGQPAAMSERDQLCPLCSSSTLADQADIKQAFNIDAQSQSETLLSINKGTKDDGAAMRAVAIVTVKQS